jgi:dTDP-4-amino-4,6-dideoxygalactose transaminase
MLAIQDKNKSFPPNEKTLKEYRKPTEWPSYNENEERALNRVLHSKVWGIGGVETETFEKTFAAYQHCDFCITMVNGSVTLRNALIACGLESGSEVIIPPYTFLATATSVLEANCIPVFVDIDPESYCLDPQKIEAAITPNTKAIIPVHLAGNTAEMDQIMEIAHKHNLYVIEDCAHAHGAEYKGKRVGSIGDIGSFSFQSSKNLCCGEGGAIVSTNQELADKCWSIHNCGRVRSGKWYQHEFLGGNYRLSQFQAAILNEQILKLDQQMDTRESNATYLSDGLSKIPGIKPQKRSKNTTRHAYHIYVFRYDKVQFDGLSRQKFIELLNAEGIPASAGYTLPIYEFPFFKKREFGPFSAWKSTNPDLDYNSVHCPVAEKASKEEGCWLPHHLLLGTKEDMDNIIDAVRRIYKAQVN